MREANFVRNEFCCKKIGVHFVLCWVLLLVAMTAAGNGSEGMQNVGNEDLNGTRGTLCRVDVERRTFELLKETVFDPKTNEGKSRHAVCWDGSTRFVKVVRQNSFAGVEGQRLAFFRELDAENAAAAAAGNPFVAMKVTLPADGEENDGLVQDERNILAPFTPDPASEHVRGGTVLLGGKPVPVRLRGPRAEVDIRSKASPDDLAHGFWKTQIWGRRDADGRFVATKMDLYPQVDPRAVDDPKLPRILVIGDSISMNYHEAAKKALAGVANYHRIDENGGPSDRGVVCMELWLGDYTQPGLHWNLIQFNHGLHDLRQAYDEPTGEYGAHQISVADYKANLEREITILKKTGATLMWCSTTPVPNNSHGRWDTGTFGRRKDEDLIFNAAALEVMRAHPEILVNDLNAFVRGSAEFEAWRGQADVHFWDGKLQEIVGKAVAEAVKNALKNDR